MAPIFRTRDDLAVHVFDGDVINRPVLTLRGRECDRSRLSVISPTVPEDWCVRNATKVLVNGDVIECSTLGSALSATQLGVVSVLLEG